MSEYMEFGLTDNEASRTREAPNRTNMGRKRYLGMVDRNSKEAERKNLPFTFGKPKKSAKLGVVCKCPGCSHTSAVTKSTVIIVCSSCNKLYDVDDSTILRK